jgi:hypothetical protein
MSVVLTPTYPFIVPTLCRGTLTPFLGAVKGYVAGSKML